ncbi:MAG: HD domain-containing protein [Ignavibacterium sp.]|jgi:hypothetical protein|uniref:HD domain-containing protein n=1 Tax=Ignavibacterium sp. TaxID=2651167 RepID=UPI003298CCF0
MFLLSTFEIKSFLVRDPIYDFIEIPEEFKPIVDHKLVQRLRWINQLPLEQLVYPSAQHSRFEHSLGVMYLAMLAANSLINNSSKQLNDAFNQDDNYKKFGDKKRKKFFILAAGLAGLLHDVGHAPFSHTLEHACEHANINYRYNHEEIGYLLTEKLFEDTGIINEPYSKTTINALNKKLNTLHRDITPIDKIIRELIDGPIDVDKGDYTIRDSYHCGTPYGIYDIQRLWRNIVINPEDYTIAVNEKGALEAWALTLQRYRMYKNVYLHHVRNITDAMLIDIIVSTIEKVKRRKNKLELIPAWNSANEISNENNLTKFIFWTDNGMLKVIAEINASAITRIESFLKRDIFKRGKVINLQGYPKALEVAASKNKNEKFILLDKLRELKKKMLKEKSIQFDFLIEREMIPPVFDKKVQEDIRVNIKDKKYVSLAEYLNFSLQNSDIKKKKVTNDTEEDIYPSVNYNLHLFIKKSNKNKINYISEEVKKLLTDFNTIA